MKKIAITSVAACWILAGCVSPEVVQTRQMNDNAMTCSQIKTELSQLDAIRDEARKGSTVSAENVAAGLFFWPAILVNSSNAKEATTAANRRSDVLINLSEKKGCS